jgi:Sodium:neurotransmitter symporter family
MRLLHGVNVALTQGHGDQAHLHAVWKGVKSVGIVVKVTVIVPWLLLAVMIIYNATLDGSRDGVRAYIGTWDMSVLANGNAWSDAAAQIFFSLSIALGNMTAYGSFAPAVANVYADNLIIASLDTATSFFAGFAVFSILGSMASRQSDAAADSVALRTNICERAIAAANNVCAKGFDCTMCADATWRQYGACCGQMKTENVAAVSLEMAFAVRTSHHPRQAAYRSDCAASVWPCAAALLPLACPKSPAIALLRSDAHVAESEDWPYTVQVARAGLPRHAAVPR